MKLQAWHVHIFAIWSLVGMCILGIYIKMPALFAAYLPIFFMLMRRK